MCVSLGLHQVIAFDGCNSSALPRVTSVSRNALNTSPELHIAVPKGWTGTDRLRFEQDVLTHANIKRHHRFAFARERVKSLHNRDVQAKPPLETRTQIKPDGPHIVGNRNDSNIRNEVPVDLEEGIPRPRSQRSAATTNQLSEHQPAQPLEDAAAKLHIGTQPTAIAFKLDYPEPPVPPEGTNAVSCPYCLLTLSSTKSKRKNGGEFFLCHND
jgi:hypothetical protein